MSKIIFMKYLPPVRPKIKNYQNLLKFDTFDISNIPISKIIFITYLPPVRPKMVPKWKMFRIYWNLAHLIFQISRSRFWCEKWFLLNIYHLLDQNWSQNWKCPEFIGIWHIWYFKYADLDFNVKKDFFNQIFTYC